MSAKMGRPLSDNPRKHVVSCKLTDIELKNLEQYCELNHITKSDVLKQSIKAIIDPDSESE